MSNVYPIFSAATDDFRQYMAETDAQAKVLSPLAWKDALVESTHADEIITGTKLPWAKTYDTIRIRAAEVSLWMGYNGHGKSQLLGQVLLSLAAAGEPVCLASFEMKPLTTLKRMLRQVAGNDRPSAQIAEKLCDWMDKKFWFYDQLGTVTPDMVYKVVGYAAERLSCKHIAIDSLIKCVRGEDDKDGQKDFVDRLTALAREHDVHIHLVHHVRKGESEDKAPGKNDARGSAAITDLVDNVFTVYRNKPKERAVEKMLRIPGGSVDADTQAKPDAYIICDKQRNGEWEGSVGLWFNAGALQYTPTERRTPMTIVRDLA